MTPGSISMGLVAFLVAAVPCLPVAAAQDSEPVWVAGGIAWLASDEISALGAMRARMSFGASGPIAPYLALSTRTSIERSVGEWTFGLRDLEYDVEAGARWSGGRARGLSVFYGQAGRERVDADGQPRVRFVGASWESPGFREGRPARGLEGMARLGVALASDGVEADGVASGAVRWSRRWALGAWGAEALVSGLVDGGSFEEDIEVGPRIAFDLAGERSLALFAKWIRGESPLGPGARGVALGFEIEEGPGGTARASPPDLSGSLSAGVRDGGRPMGRFRLAAAFPPSRGGVHAVLDVDANIRTSDTTGDLYYLYTLGAQKDRAGAIVGAWFYHRSNHVLAEANDTITSVNVLEAGAESSDWTRTGAAGAFDWRARGGVLLSSSFGERRRWHARGGVRWTMPVGTRAHPFVAVEAEAGDVAMRSGSVGLALSTGVGVRCEIRRDDQTFDADPTTVTLWATLGF